MTLDEFFVRLVDYGVKTNNAGTISKEAITKACDCFKKDNVTVGEIMGLLTLVCNQYVSEANNTKDELEKYKMKVNALEKQLQAFTEENQLSKFKVQKAMQKQGYNGKTNINKFIWCMNLQLGKEEIKRQMEISDSTYYRLLRAYKQRLQ